MLGANETSIVVSEVSFCIKIYRKTKFAIANFIIYFNLILNGAIFQIEEQQAKSCRCILCSEVQLKAGNLHVPYC